MEWEIRTRNYGNIKGEYICTFDNYHEDLNQIDASTSEIPDEHKSFNLIGLNNGQYALYPNNRCRIYDISMTPDTPKTPDFKVSTQYFQVENGIEWGRLGDTDEYFWEKIYFGHSNPIQFSLDFYNKSREEDRSKA